MRRYQLIPSTAFQTLLITTTSPITSGEIGAPYSFGFNAIGGVAPYTWSETGSLPSGLSLSIAGTLSGTPLSTFSGSFNVTATDAAGSHFTRTFNMTVIAGVTITTASPLPNASQGIAYTFTMSAAGGVAPYMWSILGQTGSNGWIISGSGVLSGNPGAAETDTINIQVVDALGVPSAANFNLTVTASGVFHGYDGTLAINSSGKLVNGHGTQIQLRGSNTAIWDAPIYSNEPVQNQIWGNGGPGGPPWATLKAQGFNAIRVTMNASAFLNVLFGTITGTASAPVWGATHQSDPNAVIKPALLNLLFWARHYGFYLIINCHSSAPSYTFGGTTHFTGAFGQPLFLDTSVGLPYWTAGLGAGPGVTDTAGFASSGLVAFLQNFGVNPATGTINDIVFELFNEPYLDQQTLNFNTANGGAGSSLTYDQIMGQGGWVSGYCNQGIGTGNLQPGPTPVGIPASLYGASGQPNTNGNANCFNWWWQAASYQQCLTGIRALGATNVVSISPGSFSSRFSKVPTYFPTDTLSPQQCALTWHPYGNGSFPNSGDPGANTANVLLYPQAYLAGSPSYVVLGNTFPGLGFPVPILADESGTNGGSTLPAVDPYIQSLTQWADGGTDTHTSTPFTGTFSLLMWACPSPNQGYIPTPFGNTGTTQFQTVIYGPTFTFTGSVSTVVQSGYPTGTGTITITNANGNTLSEGIVITAGGSAATAVFGPQISGVAGGAGVYVSSLSVTQASTTLTGQKWLPINGEGTTFFNWTSAHAP